MLECIQNADDNKYNADQKPFLRFIVGSDSIQIESNETGFEESDIRAISSVGESTKAGESAIALKKDATNLIGEKGIGFKSVFKIASKAYIRSPPYTFMFDKDKELGMITPSWPEAEAFFSTRNSSSDVQTEIVLMAPPRKGNVGNYAKDLREDFLSLCPTILMFLRHLSLLQFTIHATPSEGAIDRSMSLDRFKDRVQITETSSSTKSGQSILNYYKFEYTLRRLPPEPKRPNVESTKVYLALPIKRSKEDWVPLQDQQSVFAFLPIGKFGFKFIIQADFLTTSDREGIEEDSRWNIYIRDRIAMAFAMTIESLPEKFGKDAAICYTWVRYLSESSGPKTKFWRRLDYLILEYLKRSKVIISRTGDLLKPEDSILMDWAHGRDMMPLFGSGNDYVSEHYHTTDMGYLQNLGVGRPSSEWLIEELNKLDRSHSLASKSATWHEDIAKVIDDILGSWYDNELRRLPLIPLEDGNWVRPPTCDKDGIFFPESIGTDIPIDIDFRLVEKKASQDANRRKLFARLGVKACNPQVVIDKIADKHRRAMRGAPLNCTLAVLVSHAIYLYRAGDYATTIKLPTDQQFVCLANDEGVPMTGGSLYLDRSSVPDVLYSNSAGDQKCHFLHPLYLGSLPPEEHPSFISWLKKAAGLATVLRFRLQSDKKLHPDFRFFMESRPGGVLSILKANWQQYSKLLSPDICTEIQNHPVLCSGGGAESRLPLGETFAPENRLVQLSQELAEGDCPFLQLPFGTPADWTFLKAFNVGFDEGIHFYVWILFQVVFRTHCPIGRVQKLFKRIQDQYRATSVSEIRSRCNEYQLIPVTFIAEDDDSTAWRAVCELVWSAPRGFAGEKTSLKSIYGQDLEYFFCVMLGIEDASVVEVVLDLKERQKKGFSSIEDIIPVYEYLQSLCVNSASNTRLCRYYFKNSSLILVSDDNDSQIWKKSSDCVWSNDAFRRTTLTLKSKAALAADYNKNLAYFFSNVLEIGDAGLKEFLEDLQLLHKNESTDEATVQILYNLIQSLASDDEKLVRAVFNDFDSILISSAPSDGSPNARASQWHPLSSCVWSAPKFLKGKIVLSNHYPLLANLFCQTLKIANATPDMLVDELMEVTRSEQSIEPSLDAMNHCKALILGLAGYNKSKTAIDGARIASLQNQKCWPCRNNGRPFFQSLSKSYANDRQNLFDIFSKSTDILDFSFEQIKSLMALLTQLKFGNYLFRNVHIETTVSQNGIIDENLTTRLRLRADALYTCACYFSKGKAAREMTALKSLLHGVTVYQSSTITTQYTLHRLKESRDTGGLHIERNDILTLYVSTDRAKREYALHALLPNKMIKSVLEIPLETSYQVVSSILNLDVDLLDWILIDQGIISGPESSAVAVPDEHSNDLPSSPVQTTKSSSNSISVIKNKTEDLQNQQEEFQDRETPNTDMSSKRSRASTASPFSASAGTRPSSAGSTPGKEFVGSKSPSSGTEAEAPGYLKDNEHLLTPQASPATKNLLQITRSPRQLPDLSRIAFLNKASIQKWKSNFRKGAETNQGAGFEVESAAGSSKLPTNNLSSTIDSFDMSNLGSSLPKISGEEGVSTNQEKRTHSRPSFFASPRNEARHFGLGFLGELFVVTKLKQELQDFSEEDNWTSSLREYGEFSSTGDDISDIFYDDFNGKFTLLLMQQYHQSSTQPPKWLQTKANLGCGPKYFLEVKTTSDDLGTPFFISNAQFHNAKKRTFKANPGMGEVYVIVRVFNLSISEACDAGDAGIHMYLDPYALYEEGALRFEAKEGYAVIPGERNLADTGS